MTPDIRDIRGPIPIPIWWHWPLAIALAAVAVFGAILLFRWWRRRIERALSPLEKARRALTAAEVEARAGRSRSWAELVAATTRGALAARLGAGVLPQTTAELVQGAWTKTPLAEQLDAPHIVELLETCDLARFANARLEKDVLVASTTRAREIAERLFAPPPKQTRSRGKTRVISPQRQVVTS